MGLFGLIVMTNKVSGACYNPAVAIPQCIFQFIV